ncbi:sn-1-specific diacylglycerol lipase ABHD11-like [Asterias amurensis]|uniref:sn-1-specific diacylglycerol lipase ABHD11-like n=1 Tax=Asterias amurensis TaxID=7602 RepID=UPI003AB470DB
MTLFIRRTLHSLLRVVVEQPCSLRRNAALNKKLKGVSAGTGSSGIESSSVCQHFSTSSSTTSSISTHPLKQAVKLSYDVIEGSPEISPIIILHGVFGSKSNWSTLTKKIHKETQATVIAADLRNHGNSEHGDGMTLEVMRDDLLMLIRDELQIDHCTLIGHSLGGRVAMVTALSQPHLIEKLVVVDVSTVSSKSIFNFQQFISAMKSVQFNQNTSLYENRKSAGKELETVITEAGILQFILTNVIEREGCIQWRFNLHGLDTGLQDILKELPTIDATYNGPVLFVKGGKSQYIRKEHLPAIKQFFPTAAISTVEGAGHFVHSEKPKQFLETVVPFLKSS